MVDLDRQPTRPPARGRCSAARRTCGASTWTPADVANGRLQVRLRAYDPESTNDGTNTNATRCNNAATVSVDALTVTVYSTTAQVKTVLPVNDPITGTPLAPQNIWGAMFTSGGIRENGDRYGPSYLGNGAGGSKGDPNPDYDPNGYDYTVELSGGATNGQVRLFDPMFCATGDNGHGGSFGAGDHWTDHAPSQVVAPVAVTYRLYDMNGTPLDTSDDGLPSRRSDYDPGHEDDGRLQRQLRDPDEQHRRQPPGLLDEPGPQPVGAARDRPGAGHVPASTSTRPSTPPT